MYASIGSCQLGMIQAVDGVFHRLLVSFVPRDVLPQQLLQLLGQYIPWALDPRPHIPGTPDPGAGPAGPWAQGPDPCSQGPHFGGAIL